MSPPSKVPGFASLTAVLLAGLALSGCDAPDRATGPEASADGPSPEARASMHPVGGTELAQVRQATTGYQDVAAAAADGYTQFSPHVPGMGIHYLTGSAFDASGNSTLDGTLDPSDPEILVYVDDGMDDPAAKAERRLVAVEYAVPKSGASPPTNAVNLFSGADASDWHVHPSSHEFPPLPNTWTLHGECHYEGGIGVFLAEDPSGSFVLWTPPTGAFGSWSGTVAADECPTSLGGNPLPPLVIAHGKWWTLHAWVWMGNPEGVFHPTNPRVNP